MSDVYYKEGFVNNDQRCDVCQLQKLKIECCEETGTLQIETKKSHCLMKSKIAYLHEQILGCKKYDENAKPKVALFLDNEFFASSTFENYQEDHKCLIDIFFDQEDYKSRSLPDLKPMKTMKFTYVDAKDKLQIMLTDLKKCKAIAVNLEYHSCRSYLGFSWLLQISTENTYYMINCIKLQKDLHILNAVFMELEVLKIFHDGENSVFRLNKDFGIFVNNMFDTALLKRIIDESKEKELLQKISIFETSVVHTHFLIFLKTYLTNFLLKSHKMKFLKTMRQSCKRICENVDHKVSGYKLNFNNIPADNVTIRERHVAMGLLEWRDRVAQKEDESPNFILPDNDVFKVARELLHNNESTLYKSYGAKFLYKRETHLNIAGIVDTALRMSNKGNKSQLLVLETTMDDSNNKSVEVAHCENSEEKPPRAKSQKLTKQDKINQMKRVPRFFF